MNNLHNEALRPFSQKLRRDMTKEERHLWFDFLKGLPVTVHRQKVLGNYIADFYIAALYGRRSAIRSKQGCPDEAERHYGIAVYQSAESAGISSGMQRHFDAYQQHPISHLTVTASHQGEAMRQNPSP